MNVARTFFLAFFAVIVIFIIFTSKFSAGLITGLGTALGDLGSSLETGGGKYTPGGS